MYSIVDIETTGNGIKGNRITEISIFKFDGQEIVGEFTSLVNPESEIPYFITGLTGIDDSMVRNAPKWHQIAPRVLEMTADTIFVAHSVNFDYNVIKEEFQNMGGFLKATLFFPIAIDEHQHKGNQTHTDRGKHRYHNNSVIPIDQG